MKFITTLSIIALMAVGNQKVQGQQNQPQIKLNHIAVYVEELKQSTDFYKEVLQLTEMPEPFHDGKHTWFTLGPAGQLHLIQGAKGGIDRDKNDHLCFSVPDIEAFIANLKNKQIKYYDWAGNPNQTTLRVDGIHQIYFQDPDGHWIEINDDK